MCQFGFPVFRILNSNLTLNEHKEGFLGISFDLISVDYQIHAVGTVHGFLVTVQGSVDYI